MKEWQNNTLSVVYFFPEFLSQTAMGHTFYHIPQHTKTYTIYEHISQHITTYQIIPKHTKTYQNILKYTKTYTNFSARNTLALTVVTLFSSPMDWASVRSQIFSLEVIYQVSWGLVVK